MVTSPPERRATEVSVACVTLRTKHRCHHAVACAGRVIRPPPMGVALLCPGAAQGASALDRPSEWQQVSLVRTGTELAILLAFFF